MKIIIVGATGTLGKKVTEAFAQKHEIIRVGNTKGDIQVDITNETSIKNMFEQIGAFDALISTSGKAHFAPLNQMTGEVFKRGLLDKLLGQINLVLIGQRYINKGGSFTLTSGILAENPVAAGSALSTVNGGLNAFVLAAAPELENGVRINAISPNVVEDSPAYFDSFPGEIPVSMEKVVKAYEKSVLGILSGQVIKVY
ncbi:short chain dehydrogenase [Pedobacter alluvionis]|uniref:NAD(P)-dependent dehydrogenase (Short-subunit alcohol dehydrogenase family) n=1 Tax=Pedobacter alluvionis TaxID=475253 RepID=A0A497Y9E2_9SPHI|nr:short chain dehydrogenase [Pedobacter alluvionis]RLJ77558.1 NAD(P)-dependent dehydrogenase (short-subunit alcohol dehydrogenase family) [Pedobacter alluvionis]TFB33231.1 short chain dehydrogenase [Pedobacter alluvionis]